MCKKKNDNNNLVIYLSSIHITDGIDVEDLIFADTVLRLISDSSYVNKQI